MSKLKIFTLITIALLHVLLSWDISIYHDNLVDEQVFPSISTVIDKEAVTREDLYDTLNGLTTKVKPTYILAFALSLPFEPAIEPFVGVLISRSVLRRDSGIELLMKKVTVLECFLLIVNAIFFSCFVSFFWSFIVKINTHTPHQPIDERDC